jgi:hypothetical protein
MSVFRFSLHILKKKSSAQIQINKAKATLFGWLFEARTLQCVLFRRGLASSLFKERLEAIRVFSIDSPDVYQGHDEVVADGFAHQYSPVKETLAFEP